MIKRVKEKIPNKDDLVFSEPWQAELFALTLGLHQKEMLDWNSWTKKLGKNLKKINIEGKDELNQYFMSWLKAFEDTLLDKKVTETKNIEFVAKAWSEATTATPHGKNVKISEDLIKSIL